MGVCGGGAVKTGCYPIYTHLDQQFKSCDSLEREDKEWAKRQPLTNNTLLQFLHNPPEAWVFIPELKKKKI